MCYRFFDFWPKCQTCIQEAGFTLDNAKYWYLNFYYNFITKAIDMNRVHVTNLDTDSIYFAVAGDINEGYNQAFKHVIKDQEFYDKNYPLFFPNPLRCMSKANADQNKSDISINGLNDDPLSLNAQEQSPMEIGDLALQDPSHNKNNKLEINSDEKKLMGCCVEKSYDSMVCLGPKYYTGIVDSYKHFSKKNLYRPWVDEVNKVKGISIKKNYNISFQKYLNVLDKSTIEHGIHTGFQIKDNQMTVIQMNKNALTCAHNKMYVFENHSCAPICKGAKYEIR
jgi:hypothetical protein